MNLPEFTGDEGCDEERFSNAAVATTLQQIEGRQVTWSPQHRAFRCQGQTLRGLKPTLKALFFPRYSYGAATKGPEHKVDAKRALVDHKNPGLQGQELGGAVDREVSSLVRILARNEAEITLSEFLNHAVPLPNSLSHADYSALQYARQHMLLYTEKFLRVLETYNWKPRAANVPCGSRVARLGTAVDVVVYHPDSPELNILLELKCGFLRYRDRYVEHMQAPYTDFTDSYFYQFQLQLTWTEVLFKRTFHAQVYNCYVVNIHEEGAYVMPLMDEIRQLNTQAWTQLLSTKNDTAAERKQQIKNAQAVVQKPKAKHKNKRHTKGKYRGKYKPQIGDSIF